MRKYCRVALILVVASGLFSSAQAFELDSPLPPDPLITVGELDNGLRYYLRENNEPENRITLRLVVNAGSLQEESDQRGLAHFIEHMAFNGTERFAKQELVDYLESVGMRFGSHLNAYTSFNETVYKLEIPADDPEILETALDILEDWAKGITFDPLEIERERGVIIEEWRVRLGALQRLRENQYPVIFYDSRYAQRIPIGSTFVIRNAPRHRFVDFYNDWYRPSLMGVLVVGDIDKAAIEEKIVARFEGLTNPDGDAPERVEHEIPGHEETLYLSQSDPELTVATLSILYKMYPLPEGTANDYRENIVNQLYFGMLNRRLGERTLQADPPFLGASAGRASLGRERSSLSLNVQLIEAKKQEGINALLGEFSRAQEQGFTEGELNRVKADLMRTLERLYDERDNFNSGTLADEYTRNFLHGEPIPGITVELQMTQRFLAEIDLEEVNAYGRSMPQGEANRVVLFTAPQKDGVEPLTEEDLAVAVQEASKVKMDAYDDNVSDEPLLADAPEAGEVVEEIYHETLDTHEWILSNGARVFVKATDFKNDQILFSSYSPGGHSQVLNDEYMASVTSTMILGESGLADFDSIQLDKMLSGKAISVSPYIGNLYEGINGSTSPKDLQTFFELLYLQATQPRVDLDAYSSLQKRLVSVVANRQKSPQAVFQDAIEKAIYGEHPRHRPMSLDLLEEMDPQLSLAVFEDRFADFSDFTFVFVGALDLDVLHDYVERYVASLPSKSREEKGRFMGDHLAKGKVDVVVNKGLEQKSSVRVQFTGEAEWSPKKQRALSMAREVLNIRLREVLREEKSGTYGVGVYGNLIREPIEQFVSGFGFTCDPENVDLLITSAVEELARLGEAGPDADDLESVKEIQRRGYERGLTENNFWLRNITSRSRQDRSLETILEVPEAIESVTAEHVKQAFVDYFSPENVLIAILNPEKN